MNTDILHYVQQMEAAILTELVTTDTSDLYKIATNLIEQDKDAFTNICQAYEIVKHKLIGNPSIN